LPANLLAVDKVSCLRHAVIEFN